jgi:extracellular factor (EF) 3-hydroxypalmitic acid methyl ester biosynthesis protein
MVYTSSLLREANVRLRAAERAVAGIALNPLLDRAHGEIAKFKKLMADLDKDALKHGTISEERYREFNSQSAALMLVCHEVLGTASQLEDVQKQQISISLQHEMLPYVLTTETAERFYSKPRGYAGDYLAIHKIYENQPSGTGRLGPIVDRMFLDAPPSIAVRNRRKLLAEEIVSSVNAKAEGSVKVLCMASGPATEVFDAFAVLQDKKRLKVTLMDIDLQALAFVDDLRTKYNVGSQVTLVNENLIALFLGRGKTNIEPQDLIYSIGLTDYLNDKLVGKVLQYAYENLAPGGRVILGNFHPNNPAKEFMDSVLEWSLIHRTEEDMNTLFKNSPFGRPCTRIRFEGLGIDLFAECVKERGPRAIAREGTK